ncbi:MAG: ribose 5-phosphate isomerase B [Chloroflexota bacterium]|nr:ribose 5-phosphate isomerase B [Chloroflexota bacterium]
MEIAISSDHAGFNYKGKIIEYLLANGYTVKDMGTYSAEAVDYPEWIRPVARSVAAGDYDRGIILGGSGNGEAIVANKIKGIRCTVCWNVESAEFARQHNDSNILSIGERLVSEDTLLDIVKSWLNTQFEGGRHLRRINQIEED